MRILLPLASGRFSGGRMTVVRHALALSDRGHEVTVAVQNDDRSLRAWAPALTRVCSFRGPTDLPGADVCMFDRVRLGQMFFGRRPEPLVHFCQGLERTDIENRLLGLGRGNGWLNRLLTRRRLCKRLREIDAAYALPTIKFVTHRRLAVLIDSCYRQSSTVIPLGLPEGVFTPAASACASNNTIVVVGPLSTSWKRVSDALEAVRLLKKCRPEVRLVRVAQEAMTERERELGATDEYHTMLQPAQMAAHYRSATLLLLTSDSTEGFGLPALEAMACGLPCVLTDIAAFRTFAEPADYARFVPVAEPRAAAAALENLLDDSAERARLSQRGFQVASGYTMQRSVDAMEQALLRVAGAPRRLAA
jgi:glycosyltransferase involved in cell wall biosynthesis